MQASLQEDVERLTMLFWDINSVSLVSRTENKDLNINETSLVLDQVAKHLAFQEAL